MSTPLETPEAMTERLHPMPSPVRRAPGVAEAVRRVREAVAVGIREDRKAIVVALEEEAKALESAWKDAVMKFSSPPWRLGMDNPYREIAALRAFARKFGGAS